MAELFKINQEILYERVDTKVLERVDERINDMGVGKWWTLQRLERETGHKRDWLKDHILNDSRLYQDPHPIAKFINGRWMFRGPEMENFLDIKFDEL